MPDDVKTRIRAFLGRFFNASDLADNEDMFAAGRVNSLFSLQLVMFLEKEFGAKIENQDLSIDNFRTVDAIAALVQRKGGA
jgi:methoxymalonate biosynthesis acyl carrier protein